MWLRYVELMQQNDMLIVVHGIQLGGVSGDEADGGSVRVFAPRAIDEQSLSVVAYNYRTLTL